MVFWAGLAQLRIDASARSVHVDADEVALTPTEFNVLACLARRAGTVVSTRDLIEEVWGEWYGPVDHVFVHVHHIRRKLGPCGTLIVTKRSAGYLLNAEPSDVSVASPWMPISTHYLALLDRDAQERDVMWVLVDQQRRISWVSQSVTELLGWAPAEVLGKNPWAIAHEDEWDSIIARFPMKGGDAVLAFTTRLRRADGSVAPVRMEAQVLHGVDGHRLGGVAQWRVLETDLNGDKPAHAMPIRLEYNRDHVLISVEPRQPFLGWIPEDIIGTHFSLGGLSVEASDRVVAALISVGSEHSLGRNAVRQADGSSAVVDIVLHLELDQGELKGYWGEVRVLD